MKTKSTLPRTNTGSNTRPQLSVANSGNWGSSEKKTPSESRGETRGIQTRGGEERIDERGTGCAAIPFIIAALRLRRLCIGNGRVVRDTESRAAAIWKRSRMQRKASDPSAQKSICRDFIHSVSVTIQVSDARGSRGTSSLHALSPIVARLPVDTSRAISKGTSNKSVH